MQAGRVLRRRPRSLGRGCPPHPVVQALRQERHCKRSAPSTKPPIRASRPATGEPYLARLFPGSRVRSPVSRTPVEVPQTVDTGRNAGRVMNVRVRAGTSCPVLWRFSDAGPDSMIVTRLRAGVRKPPGEETAGATTRLEIAPVYGDLARRSRDRRSPVRRLEGAPGALTGLGVELRRGDDDRGLRRI